MTNQTIDGVMVPRELLRRTRWELDSGTPSIATLAELRALLDAGPVMCHGCMAESVSPDHFDSAGKCKAAQPQGEPVAWEKIEAEMWGAFADGAKDYKGCTRERLRELRTLYAEQPAPVAMCDCNQGRLP